MYGQEVAMAAGERPVWGPMMRTVAVWLAVALGVVYLYQTGSGGGDAPAIVEARVHKVSVTEAGTVQSIDVQPGQQVRKGDVLLRLSTADIDAQVQVLKADLERTRSSVQAGATSLASNAFNDERALSTELQAARQAELELRGAESRDRAELGQLRNELQQEQSLVGRGLVRNDRALELAGRIGPLQEQVNATQARLAAARQRVEQAGARQQQWRTQFGSGAEGRASDVQVQPLRDAVQAKTAELQALTERRNRMAITAPVDGHVTAINARNGDVVRQGDPALVVTGSELSQLVAYVVERHRLNIQTGQRVLVHRSNSTDTVPLEGRVRLVAGTITALPSRVWSGPQAASWGREVYIDLPPAATLQPGEQVQVRFMEPAFSVPGFSVAQSASGPRP